MTNPDSKSQNAFTMRESDEAKTDASGLPRIDFSTFVLSLAASGMLHLGLVPESEGEAKREPDLALAQQTIDTLEMLLEKTRGNLDENETQLIQSVLYELRMGFVRAKS